jgi:flavin reductase (DIM6/NTAB) family NADH-FMN oxidoreductase RutF
MSKIALGPQTLIYPMPVLLIGSNVDDKPNFMVAAWGGIANGEPPMISVGIRHTRHTPPQLTKWRSVGLRCFTAN